MLLPKTIKMTIGRHVSKHINKLLLASVVEFTLQTPVALSLNILTTAKSSFITEESLSLFKRLAGLLPLEISHIGLTRCMTHQVSLHITINFSL